MPSKIVKAGKGEFYARKGGAWKKLMHDVFKHVGIGKGDYSRRNIIADKHRRPRKRTYIDSKLARRYPQAYDTPAEAKRAKEWKKKARKSRKSRKTKKARKRKSKKSRKKK